MQSTSSFALASRKRQVQPADPRKKSVGVVVCEFRRKSGISQEKLGSDCGFDRTYISRLERGILNPTAIRLWAISDHLEVPFHVMVEAMETWVKTREKARR